MSLLVLEKNTWNHITVNYLYKGLRLKTPGHCWRRKEELINEILLRTPTHRKTSVGWPVKTKSHWVVPRGRTKCDGQIGTNCERVKGKHVFGTAWWWQWYLFINDYYLLIKVFHISFSWWSFAGVWMTASLLKSPGLFSVFLPFSTMM